MTCPDLNKKSDLNQVAFFPNKIMIIINPGTKGSGPRTEPRATPVHIVVQGEDDENWMFLYLAKKTQII